MRNIKRIITILFSVLLTFHMIAAPLVSADAYGQVFEQENGTYRVELNHPALANQEVALLFYDAGEEVVVLDESHMGYIDQATANDEGVLTFDNIRVRTGVAHTFDVYIGAATLDGTIKIGQVVYFLAGDMNRDGSVTAVDALYLLLNRTDPTDEDLLYGDMDNDGEITNDDVKAILDIASNKTT